MSDSEKSFSSTKREILTKGRIIGSFVVEDYIGHGGYSDIYMVSDPKERKNYAIKLEEIGFDSLRNVVEEYIKRY